MWDNEAPALIDTSKLNLKEQPSNFKINNNFAYNFNYGSSGRVQSSRPHLNKKNIQPIEFYNS